MRLSVSAAHVGFRSHFRGDQSISAIRTERLDATLLSVAARLRVGPGMGVGLRVPFGTIDVTPLGGASDRVTGLGDVELSFDYDLGQHLRRVAQPTIRFVGSAFAPTGTSQRVSSADAPPNLVSVGNDSYGVGARLRAVLPLAPMLGLVADGTARAPLTYNSDGLRFGASAEVAVGGVVRPGKGKLVELGVSYALRESSRSELEGRIINSGGRWLFANLRMVVAATSSWSAGVSVRAPLYRDVRGEQITENYSLGVFSSFALGRTDDHGGDDHGHAHGDDDHGEDDHGEGEHGGGDDDHGDGDHDHDDDHGHGHGEDDHGHGGDMKSLRSGGASFRLEELAVPGKLVVVDFWATWCKPCEKVDAVLAELARDHEGLAVRKVEVPTFDSPVVAEHLAAAKGLPIIWVVSPEGVVVERVEMVDPAKLRALVEGHLRRTPSP